MKKLISMLVLFLLVSFASVAFATDATMAIGNPAVKAIKQAYFTGSGAVSSSVTVSQSGTEVWDLISIEIHLSAAGGAANLTVTKNAGIGAAYDTVIITQDMTSVVNYLQTFSTEEVVLHNTDSLDIAWANGSSRTYGIIVKYKLR